MGADHVFLNTRIEREVDKLGFVWERRIGDSNRHITVGEIRKDGEGNENDAENESENEPHKIVEASAVSHRIACRRNGGKNRRLASNG
jgi:hypothetical protein